MQFTLTFTIDNVKRPTLIQQSYALRQAAQQASDAILNEQVPAQGTLYFDAGSCLVMQLASLTRS